MKNQIAFAGQATRCALRTDKDFSPQREITIGSSPNSVTGNDYLGGGQTQVVAGAVSVSVSGTVGFTGNFGVHGATPTSQASFVSTMAITGLSVSGVIGFASSAQFSAALTLLNTVQQVLINHGLMASS